VDKVQGFAVVKGSKLGIVKITHSGVGGGSRRKVLISRKSGENHLHSNQNP